MKATTEKTTPAACAAGRTVSVRGTTPAVTLTGIGHRERIVFAECATSSPERPAGPQAYHPDYYCRQLHAASRAIAAAIQAGPLGLGPATEPAAARQAAGAPPLWTFRTAAVIRKTGPDTYTLLDCAGWGACADALVGGAVLALTTDLPELSWLIDTDLTTWAEGSLAVPSTVLAGMKQGETRMAEDCEASLSAVFCGMSEEGFLQATTDCSAVFGPDRRKYADTRDLEAVRKVLMEAASAIGPLADLRCSDKVRAVHDWVCTNLHYADPSGERYRINWRGYQTAWSGLEERTTVCTGFARSFKLLCDVYAIPCILVAGFAGDGPHVWNYVQLDGAWYGVDCTWAAKPDGIIYDHFLQGEDFLRRHTEGAYDNLPLSYPRLSKCSHPGAAADEAGGENRNERGTDETPSQR